MMLNSDPILLNDCVLKPDRIDIWQYPLHAECHKSTSLLSHDEQNRASRFYFPRHQRRFTNAHSILRLILARYLNDSAKNLEFIAGKQGKPELLNTSFLQFNLSHSCDMALLAVGKKYPLGIDLEYFSARPYYGMGEHLFSNQENQALKNAPTTQLPFIFFNIWVQKEALIKACGLGLTYPTKQFNVPILSQMPQIIEDILHNHTWHIMTFMPEIACCAALCYDKTIKDIRYLSLTKEHLVELRDIS